MLSSQCFFYRIQWWSLVIQSIIICSVAGLSCGPQPSSCRKAASSLGCHLDHDLKLYCSSIVYDHGPHVQGYRGSGFRPYAVHSNMYYDRHLLKLYRTSCSTSSSVSIPLPYTLDHFWRPAKTVRSQILRRAVGASRLGRQPTSWLRPPLIHAISIVTVLSQPHQDIRQSFKLGHRYLTWLPCLMERSNVSRDYAHHHPLFLCLS